MTPPQPTILVVDDETPIRQMLLEFLIDEGYAAIGAQNGHAALDLARAQPPDLILLDVMMPVMDGWTTLEMLRKTPELAPIPVVLLTIAPEQHAREMRAAVLAKPVDLEHLLGVITSTLRNGT